MTSNLETSDFSKMFLVEVLEDCELSSVQSLSPRRLKFGVQLLDHSLDEFR